MREIPFVNLAAQFAEERVEILAITEAVYRKGMYVGGSEIETFEEAVADYCEASYSVSVASGTAALTLGLKALGIGTGDEVITPPNSFISSTGAIVAVGATAIFADVQDDQNIDPMAVEAAITSRTRAVMPVHLTGRIATMDRIGEIAERHDLLIIEDAAQSIGSRYQGRRSGTFGRLGCFSAHPLKNLNANGDAGFVVTNDAALADRIRRLRNNGFIDRETVTEWGVVARMDTLHAAILTMRLERVDSVIDRRRRNAELYRQHLDSNHVFVPPGHDDRYDTYHTFVIQVDRRNELKRHLAELGIATAIHYPVPIHLQPAAASLGYGKGDFPRAEAQAERILSIPIHQFLEPNDIEHVANTINGFFR